MIASLKLHIPDWSVGDAVLTFGRIRPAHLNVVAYGWASMAGVGVGTVVYNAVLLPAALMGFVHPVMAAIAMMLSASSVSINSLRIAAHK